MRTKAKLSDRTSKRTPVTNGVLELSDVANWVALDIGLMKNGALGVDTTNIRTMFYWLRKSFLLDQTGLDLKELRRLVDSRAVLITDRALAKSEYPTGVVPDIRKLRQEIRWICDRLEKIMASPDKYPAMNELVTQDLIKFCLALSHQAMRWHIQIVTSQNLPDAGGM